MDAPKHCTGGALLLRIAYGLTLILFVGTASAAGQNQETSPSAPNVPDISGIWQAASPYHTDIEPYVITDPATAKRE